MQILQGITPWVQSLSIYGNQSRRQLMFNEHCTKLDSIYIHNPPLNNLFDYAYWGHCQKLVKRNSPHLRSLKIKNWSGKRQINLPLWCPIVECSQHESLRSLSLISGSINKKFMASFWQVCLHLESLELELIYVSLPPYTSESKVVPTVQFPKLKNLALRTILHATPLQQLNCLIGLCPMLNTLEWAMPSTVPFPVKEFTDYLAARTWPELDSITIEGHSGYIDAKEYAALLRATQLPLRVLDLQLDYFEMESFTLLRQNHFKTLTKVNLSHARNSSSDPSSRPVDDVSAWVQEVLESCPSLKSINAKIITAQDMMKGKPWVCLRLEEFNVMINMEFKERTLERGPKRPKYTEAEEYQCRAVYEQLGRLTQLRRLNMFCFPWPPRPDIVPLPLELRMGLGQLSRLKGMEMVGFYGSQDMRMVDLEWMLQHWPHLQNLYGEHLSYKRSKTFGNKCVRDFVLVSRLRPRRVSMTRIRGTDERELLLFMKANDITEVYDSDSDVSELED
ncbi:hypothetical protein BGX34_009038 [Mortierella sp. NVP85]|nr:hypothetical protein BGX34_009038 [Mortierella sp. NVP85]